MGLATYPSLSRRGQASELLGGRPSGPRAAGARGAAAPCARRCSPRAPSGTPSPATPSGERPAARGASLWRGSKLAGSPEPHTLRPDPMTRGVSSWTHCQLAQRLAHLGAHFRVSLSGRRQYLSATMPAALGREPHNPSPSAPCPSSRATLVKPPAVLRCERFKVPRPHACPLCPGVGVGWSGGLLCRTGLR